MQIRRGARSSTLPGITASRGWWDEDRERAQFERQLDLAASRVIQTDRLDVGFVMCLDESAHHRHMKWHRGKT